MKCALQHKFAKSKQAKAQWTNQDNRIIKYPKLEGTHKDHQVKLWLTQDPKTQTMCLRVLPGRF